MSSNTAMSVGDIMAAVGNPDLVFTVGLPASRKSGFSTLVTSHTRLNSDSIRAELWGDESKQGDPQKVFGRLFGRFRDALKRGDKIIVDNTNLTRSARKSLVKVAKAEGRTPFLLVFDVPLSVCLQNNAARSRVVPLNVMNDMAADLMSAGPPLESEAPFRAVRPSDEIGKFFLLEPGTPLQVFTPVVPPMEKKNVDLIGDIHGCYDELRDLMTQLGWQVEDGGVMPDGLPLYKVEPPEGRLLGLVGDLVDRGPASDRVLNLAEQLVSAGLAIVVQGNHDNKLMRLLKGNKVEVGVALAETLRQIRQHGSEFEARVFQFLRSLPFKVETADLIIVHAAFKAGLSRKAFEDLAIYGEIDGSQHDDGKPVRYDRWMTDYEGDKVIVHGHIRLDEPAIHRKPNGVSIWNIDTSAVFGGSLTALRFPEMEVVQVKSRAVYATDSTR